jgi:hypothetical protein
VDLPFYQANLLQAIKLIAHRMNVVFWKESLIENNLAQHRCSGIFMVGPAGEQFRLMAAYDRRQGCERRRGM